MRIKTLTLLIPAALVLGLPQPNTSVDHTGQSPKEEEEWMWKDKENIRFSLMANAFTGEMAQVQLVIHFPH